MNRLSMLALTAILAASSAIAQESSADSGPEWRFKVGVNYVSGVSKLMDAYEHNGYESDFEWPVGFDFSFGQNYDNGLGWDVNVGPVVVILGDVESVLVPVSAAARYSFNQGGNTVPFLRAGVEYLFASGDYINDGSFGYVGGAGIEFNAQGLIGWGFEARYESAEVEFERYYWSGHWGDQKIKPYELVIGAFITF